MATQRNIEQRIRRMTPVTAPKDQRAAVAALSRVLEEVAHARRRTPGCSLVGPGGDQIAIPESVFYVLERVAEVMARGDAITVVPIGKELTTQQAADLLNVSRQYVVRLLNEKRIPYTKTGTHRRLRIEDVLAYKEQRDAERRDALDELTRLSEEAGGYSELD
jgi:excisionase family DNA binding protein